MTQQALIDPPKRATTPAAGITARHMTDMLRRHYLPENRPVAGVFAADIGSPCGKRRADLIWMPATITGGRGLHGHEIKVSRADLIVELDDPTKADPWAKYCARWWLVVAHPSLVDGLDIPASWGIMAPPSGRRTRSMTVLRPAPALSPLEPGPGIARLAAWQLYGTNERIAELARENAYLKRAVEQARAEAAQLRAGGATPVSPKEQQAARIVAAAERRLLAEGLWGHLDDEAVAAAIVDHVATTEAAEAMRVRMRMLVREVERLTDPLGHALHDLRKAEQVAAGLTKDGGAP